MQRQCKACSTATFPTQRIARMVQKDELPIEKERGFSQHHRVSERERTLRFCRLAHSRFLRKKSRLLPAKNVDAVRDELKKIQRVFQVSTTPEALRVLMEKNLHSAYTIANIPRKSFIKTYGNVLGGEVSALAIHERASHISTRAEMAAMHLIEYSHGATPKYAMGKSESDAALATIQKHLPNPTPNYAQLFGTPDICECEHCRSVYSAAAYLIELLRFLWRGRAEQ